MHLSLLQFCLYNEAYCGSGAALTSLAACLSIYNTNLPPGTRIHLPDHPSQLHPTTSLSSRQCSSDVKIHHRWQMLYACRHGTSRSHRKHEARTLQGPKFWNEEATQRHLTAAPRFPASTMQGTPSGRCEPCICCMRLV